MFLLFRVYSSTLLGSSLVHEGLDHFVIFGFPLVFFPICDRFSSIQLINVVVLRLFLYSPCRRCVHYDSFLTYETWEGGRGWQCFPICHRYLRYLRPEREDVGDNGVGCFLLFTVGNLIPESEFEGNQHFSILLVSCVVWFGSFPAVRLPYTILPYLSLLHWKPEKP